MKSAAAFVGDSEANYIKSVLLLVDICLPTDAGMHVFSSACTHTRFAEEI